MLKNLDKCLVVLIGLVFIFNCGCSSFHNDKTEKMIILQNIFCDINGEFHIFWSLYDDAFNYATEKSHIYQTKINCSISTEELNCFSKKFNGGFGLVDTEGNYHFFLENYNRKDDTGSIIYSKLDNKFIPIIDDKIILSCSYSTMDAIYDVKSKSLFFSWQENNDQYSQWSLYIMKLDLNGSILNKTKIIQNDTRISWNSLNIYENQLYVNYHISGMQNDVYSLLDINCNIIKSKINLTSTILEKKYNIIKIENNLYSLKSNILIDSTQTINLFSTNPENHTWASGESPIPFNLTHIKINKNGDTIYNKDFLYNSKWSPNGADYFLYGDKIYIFFYDLQQISYMIIDINSNIVQQETKLV